MKKIAILGSTGKIGSQALEVIRNYPKEFRVIGLACGHQSEKFEHQVKEFKPKIASVTEKDGEEKLLKVATYKEVELVVVAVVGMAGLLPTLAAIRAGKDIALATKEVLVVAGQLVMDEAQSHKINLIPIDSEHSAIFQALSAGKKEEIKRLILTMGKGRIAKMAKKQLSTITMKDVLNRPNWDMGQKIAVDSATGMNKAFEVIEAKWLFNVTPERIEIVVHPEYLCHSLVEFIDGSIIGEFGTPDMRRYIQYALFYPERKETKRDSFVDLIGRKISFAPAPFEKFPCLLQGFEALRVGGTMPAVLHGADETAVKAFIEGKISFDKIPNLVELTMKNHQVVKNPSLKEIFKAEKWGQIFAQKILEEEWFRQ